MWKWVYQTALDALHNAHKRDMLSAQTPHASPSSGKLARLVADINMLTDTVASSMKGQQTTVAREKRVTPPQYLVDPIPDRSLIQYISYRAAKDLSVFATGGVETSIKPKGESVRAYQTAIWIRSVS